MIYDNFYGSTLCFTHSSSSSILNTNFKCAFLYAQIKNNIIQEIINNEQKVLK